MAADCDLTPVVHRLGCLRAISTLTGFVLAVEVGTGIGSAAGTIGAFLGLVPSGLVPSEASSGATKARGPITTARRRAWPSRWPACGRKALHERPEDPIAWLKALAFVGDIEDSLRDTDE